MERRKEARSPAPRDFHVGRWLVQPTLNLIRDAGTVRHLEPQMMDLLSFLATTGGRVVSKDEIIDAVWEGRFIAEATLTRSIADLRRALDDDQRSPQYIETIASTGPTGCFRTIWRGTWSTWISAGETRTPRFA